MTEKLLARVILDTNTLVSAAIFHTSVPGQAVTKALRECVVLRSEATWLELEAVIGRTKFDRYQPGALRSEYIHSVLEVTKLIDVTVAIQACRDPNDDKFLELAVAGQADFLITGDADLLALHPFRGTAILMPSSFLAVQPRTL